MNRLAAASLCVVSIMSTLCPAQAGPKFTFTQPHGPYTVGLKVLEQYDLSRTFRSTTDLVGKPFHGDLARPLQILIWYPAEKSTKSPMTVGSYGDLLNSETRFSDPKVSVAEKKLFLDVRPATLEVPMWAIRDANTLPGRFPVVIYAPSFNAPSWENADLCEYLASHGYIVIASPSMGANTRTMTVDIESIRTQAQDIGYLIGLAQSLDNTDMAAVAVVGYSFGGISNLFAAAKDSRIDALICLDGSLRYFPDLVRAAGDVHPETMTIPMLYFTQGNIELESPVLDRLKADTPNVLNEWTHGDLLTVHMLALEHLEFSSMTQRSEHFWEGSFVRRRIADYGPDEGIISYGFMAKYTLEFLDAYLKHNSDALAYLKREPAENAIPKHLMATNLRPAVALPPSLDTFRGELCQKGFGRAADIYDQMQKESPGFKLDAMVLSKWADELLIDNDNPEAIAILELIVKQYPQSAQAYEELGDAYSDSGNDQDAISSYLKAYSLSSTTTLSGKVINSEGPITQSRLMQKIRELQKK